MRVAVVTDSTSDLPVDVAKALNITVVPASIHFGDKVYRDGVDLSSDDFYRKLQADSVLPKTSTPSPGDFKAVYQRLAAEHDAIASIHVASKLSATLEAAVMGSRDVNLPVSVVDSQTASMACGLLAIVAAKAARSGAGLAEIEKLLHSAIPRTITYGVFGTLEYLCKGGRIGRAQAFLGSLLKLNPILAISHGEIVPVARVRTRARAIARLCEILQNSGTPEEMCVMRTTDPAEAEDLATQLAPLFPLERMYRASIGPAMGTYVGPGAVGVSVIWESSPEQAGKGVSP